MNRKLLIGFLATALVLLLAVPFLARPEKEDIKADRELIVVSPHIEAIIYEFDNAFRDFWKAKTGEIVKIRWLYMGGGTDSLKFVLSEFQRSPTGISVDLFWGGGVDPHEKMRKEGVLESYQVDSATLARIPRELFGYFMYAPDFTWYGTALSGFGIVFNKVLLNRLGLPWPKDWENLACDECFSWVGTGDPANSSTAHAMAEYVLQGYGYEKGMSILTRIGANARRFDQHASTVNKDVALGETAMGMSIDFYSAAVIDKAGPERVGFVFPENLTVVNPDPISILKGAPHPDLARAFVSFSLTEEAQRLWLLPVGHPEGPRKFTLNRVPVLPDLLQKYEKETSVTYNPFKLEKTLPYRQDFGSKRWGILNDFLRASLIDTQTELKAAWSAILTLPKDQRAAWIARLSAPAITEEEMFRLADQEWKDAKKRNEIRSAWVQLYMARYDSIRREILGDRKNRT